jgi:hypothetical protein
MRKLVVQQSRSRIRNGAGLVSSTRSTARFLAAWVDTGGGRVRGDAQNPDPAVDVLHIPAGWLASPSRPWT